MYFRSVILLAFLLLFTSLHADTSKHELIGTWVSKGKVETRTLTLRDSTSGQFLSEHPQGKCKTDLKIRVQGQFLQASGVAQDCQQKNNPVAFEFYCQLADINRLRCKIRSKHTRSGSTKEGVEDFERK